MPISDLFKKKGVVRGRSMAFTIAVIVHVAIFIGAGSYVALTVFQKEEPRFDGVKYERPKMTLKKLQVPVKVKKIPEQKFRQTMAPPAQSTPMDLKMPAMGGIKGAMGSLDGGGLGSLGFGIRFDDNLFGGADSSGSELVGTFYDLKQRPSRMPTLMGQDQMFTTLNTFINKSWDEDILEEFFQAPKKKYAIAVMMPTMQASAAPEAFGVADIVKPSGWVVHYKGEIMVPETGRYRFCGQGDDVLLVRVNRKLVLDACWPWFLGKISDWTSRDASNRKFPLGNNTMVIGDWFSLRKGRRVPIEILVGEIPGGRFGSQLLIEQEGKSYPKVNFPAGKRSNFDYEAGIRPILPVFKMADIPPGLAEKMKVDPQEASMDGLIFGGTR